jgi:hypothetical protein
MITLDFSFSDDSAPFAFSLGKTSIHYSSFSISPSIEDHQNRRPPECLSARSSLHTCRENWHDPILQQYPLHQESSVGRNRSCLRGISECWREMVDCRDAKIHHVAWKSPAIYGRSLRIVAGIPGKR